MGSFIIAIKRRITRKVGKRFVHQAFRSAVSDVFTLDLGCGQGPLKEILTHRVGLDIVKSSAVDVIADAHCLPFRTYCFEQIACSEVLEHLRDPQRAVAEMARVLKPGGRLILSVPFCYPVHEAPHDYHRFTAYGLKNLFEPTFEILEIRPLYTEEQTLAILLQRIAFQKSQLWIRRYLYHLLAHLIFRLIPSSRGMAYQNISRTVGGAFLTAGYLLVARKR